MKEKIEAAILAGATFILLPEAQLTKVETIISMVFLYGFWLAIAVAAGAEYEKHRRKKKWERCGSYDLRKGVRG